jgi:hypothetical protein
MTRYFISGDVYQEDYQTLYVHGLNGQYERETDTEIELFEERLNASLMAPKTGYVEISEAEYRQLESLANSPQAYGKEAWTLISNKLLVGSQ